MKHYVVFVGRTCGVFRDWKYTKLQVEGFKGAIFKSFATKEIADAEFAKFNKQTAKKGVPNIAYPAPSTGIACDSSYSTKTKILEYRFVDISNGYEHYRNSFETDVICNDLGEFFALVRAIRFVIYTVESGANRVIYSDSTCAIRWVTIKKIASKIECPKLLLMVDAAIEFLKGIEKMPTVAKWQTKLWGEIPADFGRK